LTNTSVAVDTTNDVGRYPFIAIGTDGFPVISEYDNTNGHLRVAKCGNLTCSAGNTLTQIDGSTNVGRYDSIVVAPDGLPIIAYSDQAGATKTIKCGNSACSSGNTITTLEVYGGAGNSNTSIAIGANGLPIVAGYDVFNGDLRIYSCLVAACTSSTGTSPDTTNNVGNSPSMAIGRDGLPVIAETDDTNGDLRVVKCGNLACTSGNTVTAVDTAGTTGYTPSLAIDQSGLPFIVELGGSSSGPLNAVRCGSAACSGTSTLLNGGISLGATPVAIQNAYINNIQAGGSGGAANSLSLETNGISRLTIDGSGNITSNATSNLYKPLVDSATLLQVQNAAGNNYIQVDTSGANLYLGNTGIASTIQVGNTTGAVAQTINIGTNATSSSTSTLNLGQSTSGTANTNIGSANAGTVAITGPTTATGRSSGTSTTLAITNGAVGEVGLSVKAVSAQTADLLQIQDSTGANLQRIDPSGNLEVSSGYINTAYGGLGSYSNLLKQSEAFDQVGGSPWTVTTLTAPTANTIVAPDGNTTAENLVDTSSGGSIKQAFTTANAVTYTFSVWLKAASTTQSVDLRIDSTGTNAQTGTVKTVTATTTWQRFFVTQIITGPTISTVVANIFPGGTGGSNAGDAVGAWGAQLVTGTSPQVYVNTTTTTVAATTGLNVSGNSLFAPVADNTTAFQVQNAAGRSLFNVDTTGSSTITLGGTLGNGTTGGTVTNIYTSSNTTYATFNQRGGDTTLSFKNASNVTLGTFKAFSSGTGILDLCTGSGGCASGTILSLTNSTGTTTLTPGSDSTAAFQVQNNGGTPILSVDSTHKNVVIGAGATGETAGELIVLDSDTDATYRGGTASNTSTEINGSMFYSSSDHAFLCGVDGSWQTCSGILGSNTSASTAVNTCTTACASFDNGRFVIPANYLQPGKVIHLFAQGVYSTTGTPTFGAWGVYFGANTTTKTSDTLLGGAAAASAALPNNAASQHWEVDYTIVCYTAGSSGTVSAKGTFTFVQSATATTSETVLPLSSTTTTTMDTTTSQTIYLFPEWSASSASNTLTAQQFYLKTE
jgi:hypothetical protein